MRAEVEDHGSGVRWKEVAEARTFTPLKLGDVGTGFVHYEVTL